MARDRLARDVTWYWDCINPRTRHSTQHRMPIRPTPVSTSTVHPLPADQIRNDIADFKPASNPLSTRVCALPVR